MDRRTFVAAGLAGAGLVRRPRLAHAQADLFDSSVPSPQSPSFELAEATVTQLQSWLREGRTTSRRLVELYLGRIDALDQQGPGLRSVLELNPEATTQADAADVRRRAGRPLGALDGIPVLIKDNIATADRMHTSAGSLALASSIAPRDAFLAERLRAAGAVILGKTNMSEWANFRSTRSSSGWSSRGGQCRNPYALDRSPSGSSSGTGVAIAASLAAIGIGTETDGSIISPGAACGLVGLKPSVGVWSRSGIIPISATQDTAGPMTRTVTDAAILLGALTGEDPRDVATRGSAARVATDYTRFLDPDGLRGARLGVARKRYTGHHPEADRLFEESLAAMRGAGAVIVDPADVTTEDTIGRAELTVLLYEFKDGLNAYLAALGADAPVRTLADVIAFNERERARVMPIFGQELLLQSQAVGTLRATAYRNALARCRRTSRTLGIDATLRSHRLDAIVCPTQTPIHLIDHVNGDGFGGNCTTPAAVAGYPHITVPMGFVAGLPVGISFFGTAWTEPNLLKYAFAYEQATLARRPPTFRPSAG